MKKRIVAAFLTVVLCAGLAGCSEEGERVSSAPSVVTTTAPTATPEPDKDKLVTYSFDAPKGFNDEKYQEVKAESHSMPLTDFLEKFDISDVSEEDRRIKISFEREEVETNYIFYFVDGILLSTTKRGKGDHVPSTKPSPTPTPEVTPTPTPTPTPEPTPTAEPTSTPEPVSAGKLNALEKAHDYLNVMCFSYQGLIDQLEYEKFTTEEAAYAADHCGADWNEQALGKAKSYLETMSFSYTGLIDQLEYEGFTTEQATFGADGCGADWNEQAAKKAQSYLDSMSLSRDGLIDQLEYEGFTYDQAVYGVDSVGL